MELAQAAAVADYTALPMLKCRDLFPTQPVRLQKNLRSVQRQLDYTRRKEGEVALRERGVRTAIGEDEAPLKRATQAAGDQRS